MSAESRGRPASRRRGAASAILLMLLVLAPAMVVALPAALLVGGGMIPTLVAWVVDRDPEKYAALTVGPMNLAGLVPTLLDMVARGYSTAGAMEALGRPATWLLAYAAAAAGWLLYFGVPAIAAAVISHRIEGSIERQEREQADLAAEWGAKVRGGQRP